MDKLFRPEFIEELKKMRMLMVGVGGIGCELLKNIAMLPIKEIEIVDLDTVEFSNLNRQFYFRKEHVGKSKAETAAEIISKLNKSLKISAIHGSVLGKEFTVKYFGSFDVVILALDNQEARSYVNWNCMAAGVLMVDAGTNGFKGQATIHLRGLTRCYDCLNKEKPKTFQVCTIRTTPSKPIHCLIWAKHIFELLFSGNKEDNPLIDMLNEISKAGEGGESELAQKCFVHFFVKLIQDLKDSNPTKFKFLRPLEDEVVQQIFEAYSGEYNEEIDNFKIQEISKYADQFLYTLQDLMKESKKLGVLTFEKDDDTHMRFIVSCANIRSHNFGVDKIDEYNGKSLIGNIIPAVCSSNSMVAGLEVTEMLKFLQKKFLFEKGESSSIVFRSLKNKECFISDTDTYRVKPGAPMKPDKDCKACNLTDSNFMRFDLDFNMVPLEPVIVAIKARLKELGGDDIEELSVFYNSSLVYEEGDYLEEDELEDYKKKLQQKLQDVFCDTLQLRVQFIVGEDLTTTVLLVHSPDIAHPVYIPLYSNSLLLSTMEKANQKLRVRPKTRAEIVPTQDSGIIDDEEECVKTVQEPCSGSDDNDIEIIDKTEK